MTDKSIIARLQERWGVKSAFQVVVILVVFAATGFSMLYLKKPVYSLVGISPATPVWLRILVWCVTILPLYQVVLLFYGTLLGQFTFFWNFEKRMMRGIGRLFGLGKREKEKAREVKELEG